MPPQTIATAFDRTMSRDENHLTFTPAQTKERLKKDRDPQQTIIIMSQGTIPSQHRGRNKALRRFGFYY